MASAPYSTSGMDKNRVGIAVDDMMVRSKEQRWNFERRWYDNNFFDDGYHFRYVSRSQNKIVDLSRASTLWSPLRAIPKASRQIRGVANLIASRKFSPVVYPEKVSSGQYPPLVIDDGTGNITTQPNPEFNKAKEESKRVAKGVSHYLTEEYKKLDLINKLTHMIILTAKHGISYLQVWPDSINESINSMVLDAFEVYTTGHMNDLDSVPYVIKARPRTIAEIKQDERFDAEQVMKINPDNRYASSDIKEAYSRARYGGFGEADQSASIIEKEAFLKEYIDEDNEARIKKQSNGGEILQRRKRGDPIIRQVFVGGNITLRDEYLNLPSYPLVDLRFEPGPLYQVPLIERFIPQNKSYDLVVSRIERFLHTMVTGSWSIKQGEPQEPNNTAGGQIFKYNTVPPIQNPIASVPSFVFDFLQTLETQMEEQGVTTTALGKIPKGVKANAAIESLKESEFANLSIAMEQVKGTVKRVSEKILDYVDDYFVTPQTVYYMEKGEPQYFDIIGQSALTKREELKIEEDLTNVIPVKRDYRVDIQIESDLAYTKEVSRQSAKELGDYLIQLAQLGLVSPEVIKVYFEQLLETYQFGSTREIMEAMDQYGAQGSIEQDQIDKMKVAMAEVFKDMQQIGALPKQEDRIEEAKVGTAEAVRDIAGSRGQPSGAPTTPPPTGGV